jgi:hypothetical protein
MVTHRIEDRHHTPDREHETGSPWAFTDPRQDLTAIPYTDHCTRTLITQAVETLTILRAPMALGDAGATLSALVSLTGQADDYLYDAVADARDQGYTWDQIGDRLALNPRTAQRRYAGYANWRKKGCPWPTAQSDTHN